jgi:hypothetical protein
MVNCLGANNSVVPTDTTNIVAVLYITKPPIINFNGVNLSNSNESHPLMNCRLYYSQIIPRNVYIVHGLISHSDG